MNKKMQGHFFLHYANVMSELKKIQTFAVTSSTPTEKAMTNLCIEMAAKLIQTPDSSFSRPKVRPAITLWNESDVTTKAVLNKDFVLSASSWSS